jgi:hypothetical protein
MIIFQKKQKKSKKKLLFHAKWHIYIEKTQFLYNDYTIKAMKDNDINTFRGFVY